MTTNPTTQHRLRLTVSGSNAKLLRSSIACALCLTFAAARTAQADTVVVIDTPPSNYRAPAWGLGLILGEPTGFSVKRYLGRDALHVYLGGAYGPGVRFGVDYLFGLAQLHNGRSASVDVFVGAGGFVGALRGPCDGLNNWQGTCNGDGYLGARMPIGLELRFRAAPISLGLEVAPGLAFATGRSGMLVDADLALRILL
jgi:hypothetical protein